MLNKAKVEQLHTQYLQFENAISKVSYNKLTELLDVNESNLDSFDKVPEFLILAKQYAWRNLQGSSHRPLL